VKHPKRQEKDDSERAVNSDWMGWGPRVEERIAKLTERLSLRVWTFHGDRLLRCRVDPQVELDTKAAGAIMRTTSDDPDA